MLGVAITLAFLVAQSKTPIAQTLLTITSLVNRIRCNGVLYKNPKFMFVVQTCP
jgi:hypothetical protein